MVEAHRFQLRVDWPSRGVPEVERDKPTPVQRVFYYCPRGGHEFEVPFAAATDVEVEIPDEWECRQHSTVSRRDGAPRQQRTTKPPRTHWVMLRERRTIPELHELLQERLALMGHGSQLEPLGSTSSRTGPIRR
jgi:hypothetical protein